MENSESLVLITVTCVTYLNCNINLELIGKKLALDNQIIGKKLLGIVEEGDIKKKVKKNNKIGKKTHRIDFSNQCTVIVKPVNREKKLNLKIATKSGLMLGLGESTEEVVEVMHDLREANCNLLTIGQYLQPSAQHHPVSRFVTPEEFAKYEAIGREMGFAEVASSPLVRSSYRAAELFDKAQA